MPGPDHEGDEGAQGQVAPQPRHEDPPIPPASGESAEQDRAGDPHELGGHQGPQEGPLPQPQRAAVEHPHAHDGADAVVVEPEGPQEPEQVRLVPQPQEGAPGTPVGRGSPGLSRFPRRRRRLPHVAQEGQGEEPPPEGHGEKGQAETRLPPEARQGGVGHQQRPSPQVAQGVPRRGEPRPLLRGRQVGQEGIVEHVVEGKPQGTQGEEGQPPDPMPFPQEAHGGGGAYPQGRGGQKRPLAPPRPVRQRPQPRGQQGREEHGEGGDVAPPGQHRGSLGPRPQHLPIVQGVQHRQDGGGKGGVPHVLEDPGPPVEAAKGRPAHEASPGQRALQPQSLPQPARFLQILAIHPCPWDAGNPLSLRAAPAIETDRYQGIASTLPAFIKHDQATLPKGPISPLRFTPGLVCSPIPDSPNPRPSPTTVLPPPPR